MGRRRTSSAAATMHRGPRQPAAASPATCRRSARIEFAAQAMAVHGSLVGRRSATTTPTTSRAPGFLASVRNVRMDVDASRRRARRPDDRGGPRGGRRAATCSTASTVRAGDAAAGLGPRGRRAAGRPTRDDRRVTGRRAHARSSPAAAATSARRSAGGSPRDHDVVVHANSRIDRAQAVVDAIVATGGRAHGGRVRRLRRRGDVGRRSSPARRRTDPGRWSTTPASTTTRSSPACAPTSGRASSTCR